jgi:hypothetical protein
MSQSATARDGVQSIVKEKRAGEPAGRASSSLKLGPEVVMGRDDERGVRSVALGLRGAADRHAHEADADILELEVGVLADEVGRRRRLSDLGERVAGFLVLGDERVDGLGVAGRDRVLLDEVGLLDDRVGVLRREGWSAQAVEPGGAGRTVPEGAGPCSSGGCDAARPS